jgi:hypothetical protein
MYEFAGNLSVYIAAVGYYDGSAYRQRERRGQGDG